MSEKANLRALLTDAGRRGINYREEASVRHVAPIPDAVRNVQES